MRKKGKGQLLILVLGVMAIGMLTISPLLAYVDLSLKLSGRANLRSSAYYAAEAGIQMVIGDLYQAQDPTRKPPYRGTMNRYDFNATATYASTTAAQSAASTLYFDPAITMYMRPMAYGGCNCYQSCAWNSCYPFVATKGKTLKINWAGYTSKGGTTSDADRNYPYDYTTTTIERLNTTISLFDSNGSLVAFKAPTPEEVYASDQARLVATTLVVPGTLISGGTYHLQFKNLAKRGASAPYANSYASSQRFMSDSDEDWCTFNGSITRNCSDFVADNGNVTVMVINEDNGDRTRGLNNNPDVNTFSFFCDYVSLSVTSNVSGNITTNTYTYNTSNASEGAGVYNKSYWGITTYGTSQDTRGMPGCASYHTPATYGGNYYPHNDNDTWATNISSIWPSTNLLIGPLNESQYSKIAAPDGNRMLGYPATPPTYKNSCLWHVFNIPEGRDATSRSKITSIDVHWEGYQTKAPDMYTFVGDDDNRDDDELYLLLWNYRDTYSSTPRPRYHILAKKQVDAGRTWVKIEQGGYEDYIITSTSSRDGEDAVTITCYVRLTPGTSKWWEEQGLDVLSWNVEQRW